MNAVINEVLNWGRSTGAAHIVDTYGAIDAEKVRRELRQMFVNRFDNGVKIVGNYRQGYELMINNERIGVTNGYGAFKTYYRNAKPVPQKGDCLTGPLMSLDDLNEEDDAYSIPFMGEPVVTEEWAEDFGLQPAF